jgi:hypothetical protein
MVLAIKAGKTLTLGAALNLWDSTNVTGEAGASIVFSSSGNITFDTVNFTPTNFYNNGGVPVAPGSTLTTGTYTWGRTGPMTTDGWVAQQ